MRRLSVAELKARWQESGELYTPEELSEIWDDFFARQPLVLEDLLRDQEPLSVEETENR